MLVTLPEAPARSRGWSVIRSPRGVLEASIKALGIMPCHAMHGRWLSLTLVLPQQPAKHLPYKELL
jgi:hypothetical protein